MSPTLLPMAMRRRCATCGGNIFWEEIDIPWGQRAGHFYCILCGRQPLQAVVPIPRRVGAPVARKGRAL